MKHALSRAAMIGIVVIVIILIAIGGFVALSNSTSSSSTSTSSSSSQSQSASSSSSQSTSSQPSSSSSSSQSSQSSSQSTSSSSQSSSASSSSSSSSSNSSSPFHQLLTIDDWTWFVSGTDLNELYINGELPWPNSLAYTVYQSLVTVNETAQFKSGNIQYLPGLATGWNVSSDGTTYTFNLRQNVKFSSGNPFNAYQAWMELYGLYYLTANSSTWMESYPLFNMNTAHFGPATIALINQSGLISPSQQALNIMMNSSWPIYVTGPYTIVFHLSSPFIFFPGVLVVYDG